MATTGKTAAPADWMSTVAKKRDENVAKEWRRG